MNNQTDEQERALGPPFTPQPPPPGLGVIRSILLVLMAAVGAVDLFLMGGIYLSFSTPGLLPVASPTVQATNTPASNSYSIFGGTSSSSAGNPSIPVNAEPVRSTDEAPAQSETATSDQQAPDEPPAQTAGDVPESNGAAQEPPQNESTQPSGQQPEGGQQNAPPALAPDQQENENNTAPSSSNNSGNNGNGNNFNANYNPELQETDAAYVLNTNTRKFHYPSCADVAKMATKNYATSNDSRDAIISSGYSPCGHCNP